MSADTTSQKSGRHHGSCRKIPSTHVNLLYIGLRGGKCNTAEYYRGPFVIADALAGRVTPSHQETLLPMLDAEFGSTSKIHRAHCMISIACSSWPPGVR